MFLRMLVVEEEQKKEEELRGAKAAELLPGSRGWVAVSDVVSFLIGKTTLERNT